MATTETQARPVQHTNGRAKLLASSDVETAAFQAFWLLRIGFTVAPILFGVDKFFNWSVHWPDYLAGWLFGQRSTLAAARAAPARVPG